MKLALLCVSCAAALAANCAVVSAVSTNAIGLDAVYRAGDEAESYPPLSYFDSNPPCCVITIR